VVLAERTIALAPAFASTAIRAPAITTRCSTAASGRCFAPLKRNGCG